MNATSFSHLLRIVPVTMLSLLMAEAGHAQTPKWLVPAGERRVALSEASEGTAKRWIIENGFLRAVVNPDRGGRIESLVYKKTGREMTLARSETRPGGLLSDQVWQQNYWHGDWNDAPYEAVVVARPPEAAQAQLRLTGKGRLWAGITISKQLTLSPNRSAIAVSYEMTSAPTVDKRLRPDFWFHNALAGPGRSFLPSPAGVLARPLAAEPDTWVYEPTQGWNAFISDHGVGIAATMEFRRLRGLHAEHTPVSTVEWVWRHVMAEGMNVSSPVQLGFFSGLKEVTGVCDDAVIEMTVEPPGQARVTVAALADLDAHLSLQAERLEGTQRRLLAMAPIGMQIKLQADTTASYDVKLPLDTPGSFVIRGTLLRGDKPLAVFEKELLLGTASGTYAMAPEGPREPDRGRRTYIPFDLNFNKLAYETPHIPWAKPYAGGRPRVLALLPARGEREAIELAQRFDMDLTCSVLATELGYLLGDGYNTLRKQDIEAHLDKVLAPGIPYDAVIVGDSWGLLTPKARERVLALVEKEGAGLLFIGPAPVELKSTLPLEGAAHLPAGPWSAPADSLLAAALPLAAIPSAGAFPSVLRKMPDGLDENAPQPLLMSGKAVIAASLAFGKGRIVQLTARGPLALRYERMFADYPFNYWEYGYALLGRLLYHAAGKPSPVDLLAVVCRPEEVVVRLRSRTEGAAKVHVRLRDTFGAALDERDLDAALKKAGEVAIALTPSARASGYCLADVTVSNAAGTLAWGAGAVTNRPVRIAGWAPDKVGYRAGERITLTATLKGPLPANAKLRAELWDGAGRRAVAAEAPAVAPETRLSLPVERLTTPIFEARGILLGDAGVIDQAACEAWVKMPRRRDRLETFFWGYPQLASSPFYMVYDYYRRFREMGMTANWGDKHPEAHAWAFERLGMAFEVSATGMSWGGITKADAAKEPDKAVPNSIGDPAIDPAKRASGERNARTWSHRNVLAYGCADENRDPPPDVCFCTICLAAFRKWLQETQYKTVADLNREWKTEFKTWDDVMPMTVAEIKEYGAKNGSYAAWADQRQFNKVSYANHARAFTQGVLSGDPEALVGDSGTQESFPNGARDYSLLAPAYTAMAAYPGTQTPEQDGMAPNLIRFNWTGYSKSGPRAKNQTWMHLGGNNYGFGVFVSGTYIDPDLTLPTDGRDMQVALREMGRGAGQMLVSARKAWDPVYLLQSMPSLHGAFIIGQHDLHKQSVAGYMGLMVDLGTNYRAISGAMVGDGYLQKSGARVLVLPHMVALSDAECRAMREWVAQGGTLIADLSPGIMTEHCRMLPKGQLDDLFGVDRSAAALSATEAAKTKDVWELRPADAAADAPAWPCNVVEKGVRGNTAQPLWVARLAAGGDPVPVLYHRSVGKGHAWYLACNFFGQHAAVRNRLPKEPGQVPVLVGFQQVFEKAFATAGVKPGAVVYLRDPATGARGVRAPYVWVYTKDLGKNRCAMIMRDFYIHDSAPLDQPVQVVFDRTAHIYEALAGRYIGYGDAVDMTLTDYTLRIFSLLPYRVDRMDLRAPADATAGSDLVLSAALATTGGAADSHWFRVDVMKDGRAMEPYCLNVEAPGGRAEVRIPFALNDPAGAWRVRVQDVATGVAAEAQITLK